MANLDNALANSATYNNAQETDLPVPADAGEFEPDLLDIISRIPERWGRWISCDKGWYALLADTNRKLKFMCPNYEIQQVKEKFGSLRFYWSLPDSGCDNQENDMDMVREIMEDIVSAAETNSAHICESCGKHGSLRDSARWYKTLCFFCAREQNYPVKDWELKFFDLKIDNSESKDLDLKAQVVSESETVKPSLPCENAPDSASAHDVSVADLQNDGSAGDAK